jgi:hypothetical protein
LGLILHIEGRSSPKQNTKNKMKTYTFALASTPFSTEAANYAEALAALVFEVGSEVEAAKYAFISAE